jgi:hypothetical protein
MISHEEATRLMASVGQKMTAEEREALGYYLQVTGLRERVKRGEVSDSVAAVTLACIPAPTASIPTGTKPDYSDCTCSPQGAGVSGKCLKAGRCLRLPAPDATGTPRSGNFCSCTFKCGDAPGWEEKLCCQPHGMLREETHEIWPKKAIVAECIRCHAKSNDEAETRCRPEMDSCPMEDSGNRFAADCVIQRYSKAGGSNAE